MIIVSWNARKFLEECLDSLSPRTGRPCEVIVVDNASTDGSPEMVTSRFNWVKLIPSGQNLGFSKANNLGIGRSRGKYLALVNSDVNVLPGCLDRLAQFLDDHPAAGMVGPRVMYGDRRQQSSCRRFPSLWNNLCEVLYLNRLFPRSEFFAGEHMFYFSYDRTREVEVIVGCFLLARRDAVDQFGLLDENFWMYGEDLDWSRRCWKAGWKNMFFPGAEAIHYCGGSSASQPVRLAVAQQKSRLLLWRKHLGALSRAGMWSLAFLQCVIRLVATGLAWLWRKPERASLGVKMACQTGCIRALIGNDSTTD